MNSALQELATLLPAISQPSPVISGQDVASTTSAEAGAGPGASANAATNTSSEANNAGKDGASSKANTVERAIEYIRLLQVELATSKEQLEAVGQQLGGPLKSESDKTARPTAADPADADTPVGADDGRSAEVSVRDKDDDG